MSTIKINQTRRSAVPSENEIRVLISRFYEGTTTLAEERAIYAFFEACPNLPPDLEAERKALGWFASKSIPSEAEKPDLKKSVRMRLSEWAAAAASAAAIVTGIVMTSADCHSLAMLRESYAGSCIVENGRKLTEINEILPAVVIRDIENRQLLDRINSSLAFSRVDAHNDSIRILLLGGSAEQYNRSSENHFTTSLK